MTYEEKIAKLDNYAKGFNAYQRMKFDRLLRSWEPIKWAIIDDEPYVICYSGMKGNPYYPLERASYKCFETARQQFYFRHYDEHNERMGHDEYKIMTIDDCINALVNR